MKVLVFSDTHLGKQFNKKKFLFLKTIIQKADKIIINGDFWEGYTTTFNDFINSPWKDLFPFLKKKETIYIFGNHDRRKYSGKNVALFCDKAVDQYSLKTGRITYYFEHGNRWSDFVDAFFGGETPGWFVNLYNGIINLLVKILGKRLFIVFKLINNKVKKKAIKSVKNNIVYVFGHTHCGEIDLINHFANSGLINYGFGQYLLIDDGKLSLRQQWY